MSETVTIKRVGEFDQGRFKMSGNLFIIDDITQYENAAVVRFHSATDIYSVYEWTMEAVMRAMDND